MRTSLLVLLVLGLGACTSPQTESGAKVTYRCESGRTVEASYPTDSTAVVDYEGQTYEMEIAVSGSGARYVGGGLEWWTKGGGPGAEGTLFRHDAASGASGETLELCEEEG